MLARLRWGWAVLVASAMTLGACHVSDEPTPDGSGSGLSILWSARPEPIPSEPSSDRTIERAIFHLDDPRLVGDAGSIDLDLEKLEWSRGIVPAALPVAGALPGLYSRFLFELEGGVEGGGTYGYEITGTVKINDSFQPFTIRDAAELGLSLDLSIMLPAGGSATIPVRVNLDKIVGAVNFAQVPKDDGRYLVDSSSPQISAVRAAVRDAFSVSGPD